MKPVLSILTPPPLPPSLPASPRCRGSSSYWTQWIKGGEICINPDLIDENIIHAAMSVSTSRRHTIITATKSATNRKGVKKNNNQIFIHSFPAAAPLFYIFDLMKEAERHEALGSHPFGFLNIYFLAFISPDLKIMRCGK